MVVSRTGRNMAARQHEWPVLHIKQCCKSGQRNVTWIDCMQLLQGSLVNISKCCNICSNGCSLLKLKYLVLSKYQISAIGRNRLETTLDHGSPNTLVGSYHQIPNPWKRGSRACSYPSLSTPCGRDGQPDHWRFHFPLSEKRGMRGGWGYNTSLTFLLSKGVTSMIELPL